MIQAAHIGVGISGREGRAAVQAADFAFGQFRFLVRLLLLHGRQSYLRCREVVLYAFYKNVAYVSCFVLYSIYSGTHVYIPPSRRGSSRAAAQAPLLALLRN